MAGPSRRTGAWRLVARSLVPALTVAWGLGQLLGDRPDRWTLLFFIPALLVAVTGLAWCWVMRLRVPRGLWWPNLLLALWALAHFGADLRWHPRATSDPPNLRVVHWNIAHVHFGLQRVLDELAPGQPDLVLLSECRHATNLADLARARLGLPYTFHDQGMAVLSRYPFTPQGTIKLTSARAWWSRVETPAGALDLAVVDLVSHPFLNRREPLDALAAWVANRTSPAPLLIAGDFNTPRDARSFRPLRAYLQHAYETAGRGWPYSWPLPVPLYSIDHTWYGPGLTVRNYRLEASPWSDHLRQVMDVEILPVSH